MAMSAGNLEAELNRTRMEFLRSELATCFTLVRFAEAEHSTGDYLAAAQSVAHAEHGFSTLVHFLSDPKHAKHIDEDDWRELTAGMAELRVKLNALGETRKRTERR